MKIVILCGLIFSLGAFVQAKIFTKSEYLFENLDFGKTHSLKVNLHNTTQGDLALQTIMASCPCLRYEGDSFLLSSGEKKIVTFSYRPAGIKKESQFFLSIQGLLDGETYKEEVAIKLIGDPEITFSPPRITWTAENIDEPQTLEVSLRQSSSLKLGEIYINDEAYTSNSVISDDCKKATITIKCRKEKLDRMAQLLVMTVDSSDQGNRSPTFSCLILPNSDRFRLAHPALKASPYDPLNRFDAKRMIKLRSGSGKTFDPENLNKLENDDSIKLSR